MTQFDDRIEGEIKTHEKEMLKKAVIAKYGGKSLEERIKYVTSTYAKDNWTAEELFAKLTELELIGKNTREEVEEAFKKQPDTAESKPLKGFEPFRGCKAPTILSPAKQQLHIPPILPTHIKKRLSNLSQ